ncbi:MarR family transcriptional regulator [Streptomyces noursei]|uniref:MarR family transcriptional regulator n=1 Tax=Streptomyces noursei TaxID=1971 RepID=UPI00332B3A69
MLKQLVPLPRGQSPHPDLTPSRLAALAELAAHGSLRIGELAARMNITLSTTSRMVDQLDGNGWIARRPDPADQRASLISRNYAGRALLCAVRRETAGVLAEEIGRLDAGRRRRLRGALPALEELTEALRRRPPKGRGAGADRRTGNGRM